MTRWTTIFVRGTICLDYCVVECRGRYAARFHATDRLRINIDPDNTARSRCLFQSVKDDHG